MQKRKTEGMYLFEIVVLILILALVGFVVYVLNSSTISCQSPRRNKCKANLTQFRTALTQYQLDLGRQIYYPQKQGQGFLTTLYEEQLLVEVHVYTCRGTKEWYNTYDSLADMPELGDDKGPVSYAGRINTRQDSYPGLFKLTQDSATTPIVSDDFASPNEYPQNENHLNGTWRNILFLDGHVDHIEKDDGDFSEEIMFDVLRN